jgi:hypothetical protein
MLGANVTRQPIINTIFSQNIKSNDPLGPAVSMQDIKSYITFNIIVLQPGRSVKSQPLLPVFRSTSLNVCHITDNHDCSSFFTPTRSPSRRILGYTKIHCGHLLPPNSCGYTHEWSGSDIQSCLAQTKFKPNAWVSSTWLSEPLTTARSHSD